MSPPRHRYTCLHMRCSCCCVYCNKPASAATKVQEEEWRALCPDENQPTEEKTWQAE